MAQLLRRRRRPPRRVLHHARQARQDRARGSASASCARPATTPARSSKLFDLVLSADGELARARSSGWRGPSRGRERRGREPAHDHPRGRTARAGGRFTVEFDASLVRGMGYYTGPIFEAAVRRLHVGPSPAAAATTGWSAGCSARTFRPAASRSGSSGSSRSSRARGDRCRSEPRPGRLPASSATTRWRPWSPRRPDACADGTATRLADAEAQEPRPSSSTTWPARASAPTPCSGPGPVARGEAAGPAYRERGWRRCIASERTTCGELAARARRAHGPALGLGPPQARSRPSAVRRSARPLRHHPVRARRRRARCFKAAEALRLESVITVTGQVVRAGAGHRQPEAADRARSSWPSAS